jgi:hypothetical protein
MFPVERGVRLNGAGPSPALSKARRLNAYPACQRHSNAGNLCTAVQFVPRLQMPAPHFDIDII